jgi:hypothetical protein
MNPSVARICLTTSVIVLVLSGLVPAMPGNYWAIYLVVALTVLGTVITGRRFYRIAGSLITVLAVTLIVADIRAGRVDREKTRVRHRPPTRHQQMRQRHQKQNGEQERVQRSGAFDCTLWLNKPGAVWRLALCGLRSGRPNKEGACRTRWPVCEAT